MDKGILNINRTKKGKLNIVIKFGDDKQMPIVGFDIKEEHNGKECEVERVNGQIVKVFIDGKKIEKVNKNIKGNQSNNRYSKNSFNKRNYNNRSSHHNSHSNSSNDVFTAKAPFNFVPLNDKVVKVDKPEGFNKYYGNTGYIEIEAEALTPIFIKRENDNSEFYKQAEKYRIPGSSFRGMIRTLIEIASYSKFGFSQVREERRYFYRKFTDKSKDLEEQYRRHIVAGNRQNGFYNKVKAGYIKRTGLYEYKIIPAEKINGTQFFRVEDDDVVRAGLNQPIATQNGSPRYKLNPDYEEKVVKILFEPGIILKHSHSVPMRYAKVTSLRKYSENKDSKEVEGYLLCTGYIGSSRKGKHLHWIIGPISNNNPLQVPEALIDDFNEYWDYKKKISGFNENNPIKKLRINGEPKPCFYQTNEKNEVISFGFTGHYALPYDKTLNNFIPPEHLGNDLDIAEAMFGKESEFMTRLFFEDLFLAEGDYNKVSNQELTPKILAEPKPTAFQLYLEQNKNDIKPKENGWEGIKSYNDNTVIRGNKLYWHIKDVGDNWQERDNDAIKRHTTQYTKIKPIDKGAKFKGRIRFENLTDVELGALLFVLNLPQGCNHKIGMAKPLGLGSIKVSSKLYLSDRKKRYQDLFYEAAGISEESDIKEYIEKFEKYVLEHIEEEKEALWDTERMRELKTMLTFENRIGYNNLTYMDLREFRERKILP